MERKHFRMDNLVKQSSDSETYKVAIASNDGIVVNQHFGRADIFYIYEVTENGKYGLLETRKIAPVCSGGNHDDSGLWDNVSKFKDCKYILASRIGMGAANVMEQSGIIPMELPGIIGNSIGRLIAYEQLQSLL